jgi:DNA polymerase-3 subunit epsilon
LEDAKAAAHIILRASGRTGLTLEQWLKRVKQPIDPSKEGRTVTRDPSADGPLSGEVVVFTGALKIPRREAADIAAGLGCRVEAGVTQRTTLLVVGDQDVRKLAGHDKSAKHRKAEALICDGQSIRIVRETDFRALAGLQ